MGETALTAIVTAELFFFAVSFIVTRILRLFSSPPVLVRACSRNLAGQAQYNTNFPSHIFPENVKQMPSSPSKKLETFPNPNPDRDYMIHMKIPEFTCLCPMTGQPDFAVLTLEYVADRKCVELKSLKQYIWSFRSVGAFHEAVTNRILDDLVAACNPHTMTVVGDFNVRGGLKSIITATATKPAGVGWRGSACGMPPDVVRLRVCLWFG